ncbi:unnamed protein product [Rhizophagus irregularis]|nr:unnamed protein product [Rhizophagus irregularis]
MNSHVDEHYCLASVKGVKSFATAFPQDVLIISQDDKAKFHLEWLLLGRTFKTIQTTNEPVSVPDHDFPKAAKHKLVPSHVLRNSYGGSHVNTKEENFREFTHNGDTETDLDYLTVRTHAPGQSAYNPVERSMASLSGKLAGVELNAFTYFPSKAFLKQHTKTIHSGERVPVERVAINVVIEASKYLQQDYEYNAESTQDDENENSNDNTSQELQKEKTNKKSRGRPRNYKHN